MAVVLPAGALSAGLLAAAAALPEAAEFTENTDLLLITSRPSRSAAPVITAACRELILCTINTSGNNKAFRGPETSTFLRFNASIPL
jgi:hypothetical protein